jgi:hypothetical protein
MLNYRYLNLCIKAEQASLVPVKVMIEGEGKNLEDVANVAMDGEYGFKVFPKYEEDLLAIGKGIAMVHPEFKQERKSLTVEMDDGQKIDVEYLLLTMPEVDDNRYDVLKQATNAMYEECKIQMEAAKSEVEAQIALLSVDEKAEDIDKVKDAIKELNKTWTEKRDQLHEDKLKEIEEAHQKYLQNQAAAEQKRKEQEQATGDGGKTLDMSQLQG